MKKILVALLAVMMLVAFTACDPATSDAWTIGVRLAKVNDTSFPGFEKNNTAIKDAWTFSDNVLTINVEGLELTDETSVGQMPEGFESEGAWVCFLFDAKNDLENVRFNNSALGADNTEPSIIEALDGSKRADTEFVQWINLSDTKLYGEKGRVVSIDNGENSVAVRIVVEGTPLVKIQFYDPELYEARKNGVLKGLSIGAVGCKVKKD